ncbi:hypothetical protein CTAYLR_000772 [Chrysophaeum taylorii]|uniref:Phosphatidylinositol 3-kinase n=1 Tax=Chrysophaeum taylorii TaxID=2483200 RepID=A0AAD7UP82_9STRA|nr:hypothetical protein CTAYLR_000772 [Chrysophaeum taylorii]
MFKSFSFFPSHAGGVEMQCGVCEVELPIESIDPYGLFWDGSSERSVWYRGSSEEFHVRATMLCHGVPMHSVPVRTRAPSGFDERRCSVVWGELLRFPVKVRELTSDATLALSVVGEDGRVAASASLGLFDDKGVLKQGLVKLALRDERPGDDSRTREADAAASRAAALGGGRGAFVDELRGDLEYEWRFEATDYLFRADKLRQVLAAKSRLVAEAKRRADQQVAATERASRQQQNTPQQRQALAAAHQHRKEAASSVVAWLDELALARVNATRRVLGDRESWFKSAHTTRAERSMLSRAFLVLDLPTFDYPVLWEEKPYAGAPHVPAAAATTPDRRGATTALEPPRAHRARTSARALDARVAVKRGVSAPQLVFVPPEAAAAAAAAAAEDDARSERRPSASSGSKQQQQQQQQQEAFLEEMPLVYDYEDGVVTNPIEDKYRALARDATRALVDRDLKPNVDEARSLARVIASPSDELAPADRELVWKFRYTLKGNAKALPKFLLSVDWRVEAEVAQVRELLDDWRDRAPVDIADALKLLGPDKAFQHDVVRSFAVDALRSATDEELIAYLLQLVQALRYSESTRKPNLRTETASATTTSPGTATPRDRDLVVDPEDAVDRAKEDVSRPVLDEGGSTGSAGGAPLEDDDEDDSPLALFLSDRACSSLAVANFVWWYLKVGADDTTDEAASCAYRVFRARFAEDLSERAADTYDILRAQEQLVASVLSAQARARQEKGRKDHKQDRLRGLLADLRVPSLVSDRGVPIPLDPSVKVEGLHDPKTTCRMYRSAMYPALVAFERHPDLDARRAELPPKPTTTTTTTTPPASTSDFYRRPRLFSQRRRRRPPHDDIPATESTATPGNGGASTAAAKSFFLDTVGSLATAAFGTDADQSARDSTATDADDADANDQPLRPLAPYRVLVKNGDDIRQDQLILQFVLLMDLLLKRVNLDLKLTCFRALATGATSGLIEFVEDSHAISSILADHHNSIVDFLRVHNPDPSAPDGVSPEARDNFTKSCAGYCVITYLLGVGDRHLDNIMIRNNGCLFHIDFGFILGKDPKPYPPPFRLTKEMAEAMGYPDDPNYTQKFKTKCCQAFNCLRKHAPLLLNLMSLMKDAGIEHLSESSFLAFTDRFRLDLNNEDAERFFLSLIDTSLHAFVPVVLERFHKIAVWMK